MLLHVKEIDTKLKKLPYLSLSEVKKNVSASASGFYWIYSDLSMEDLKNSIKPTNPAHINFMDLSNVHADLNHVIKPSNRKYWCIYNGKGKQLKNRIVAEFTDTPGKTGKLALLRCFEEKNFKIKYVICGDNESDTGIPTQYAELETSLERAWRLHLGWPVLCRA